MPPSLWNLKQTLFDDFNDPSTVDRSNTHAPGFNWYVDPAGQFATPPINTPALRNMMDFDVSGSNLNMHMQDDIAANEGQPWIMTVVTDGTPHGYIGQTFALPLIMEARFKVGTNAGGYNPIWWTSGVEGIFQPPPSGVWPPVDTVEPDFAEFDGGTSRPVWVTHYWKQLAYPIGSKTFSKQPWAPPAATFPDFTLYHSYGNLMMPQAAGFPTSGASRNILPNSSFAGAVAGTPGTLPSNMSLVNSSGLSVDVASLSGGKLQLRFHGTASGAGTVSFFLNSLAAFSTAGGTIGPGQIWTASISVRLAAGSDTSPDVFQPILRMEEA